MNNQILQVQAPEAPVSVTVSANGEARVFPVVKHNTFNCPDAFVYDPSSGFPIFRAPSNGHYRFSGIATVDSGDSGSVRLGLIPEVGGTQYYGGVGPVSVLSPVVLNLLAGDLVSFRVYNPGAAPVTLQSGSSQNYGLVEYLGH